MGSLLSYVGDDHWNDLGDPCTVGSSQTLGFYLPKHERDIPVGAECEKCMVDKLSEHIKSVLVTGIKLCKEFGLKWLDITKELFFKKKNDRSNVAFTSSLTLFLQICADLLELPVL